MREIKFRGKSVLTGEWVYGSLLKVKGIVAIVEFDDVVKMAIIVDEETVGQYIGIKVRHGTELCECDIADVWRTGIKRRFQVKWREEGAPRYILYPQPINEEFWNLRSDMHMSMEKVGDIYDNPELLNKKTKE